jgi:hypothetical protein
MPELTFRDWVEKKDEEAHSSERMQRQAEWLQAYGELKEQIRQWLREDGLKERIAIQSEWVQRRELGLGTYNVEGLRIEIGDSSVKIEPMGRSVIGSVNPPGGGEFRASGRVDIGNGVQKYVLYRTIQDGKDVWYAVDEDRYAVTPFTRERLQEILMDLMS